MSRPSQSLHPSKPFPASTPTILPPAHSTHDYITAQWLDEVAAGTEKSIRDTPAWKVAVKQLGLKEARRRLRMGCLASQLPGPNPAN